MEDIRIKEAINCENVLNQITVDHLRIDGKLVDLKSYKSSELSSEQFQVLLQMTEDNMKDFYEQSSTGWSREVKLKEFQHKTAKFLILLFEDRPIAFCHFRFEHGSDDSEACVYCYEIQVADEYQRRGVGRYLMDILPLLAIRFKIFKVMLTVFKHNPVAMGFYVNSLKFRIDKSSPSKFNEETDYEILSLKVSKNWKMKQKL